MGKSLVVKFIVLFGCSLVLQSCANLQLAFHDEIAVAARKKLSADTVFVNVKFRAQSNINLCGVAALHMFTDFYQTELPASELKRLTILAEVQSGLTGLEIKNALLNHGYSAFVIKGDLGEGISGVRYYLKKAQPLFVMLKSETQQANINHMVLLVGLDTTKQKIIYLDPQYGQTIINVEVFRKLWKRANNFMLVASPENGVSNEKTD